MTVRLLLLMGIIAVVAYSLLTSYWPLLVACYPLGVGLFCAFTGRVHIDGTVVRRTFGLGLFDQSVALDRLETVSIRWEEGGRRIPTRVWRATDRDGGHLALSLAFWDPLPDWIKSAAVPAQ